LKTTSPNLRGQASIEWLLCLPVVLLVLLGIFQLSLLAHARLLTDYAAYSAARAGIVWNGNPSRMRDAALLALLPLRGRTDTRDALTAAFEREENAPWLQVETVHPRIETVDPGILELEGCVLTVQVTCAFELKIPFADAAVYWAWRALHPEAVSDTGYSLPLTAVHSMRMESAFHRKFLAGSL